MNAHLQTRSGWSLAAVLLLLAAAVGCNGPTTPAASGITITVNPVGLPAAGGSVVIEATVTSSSGTPIPNIRVSFTASAGTLSAATANSDSEGIARVMLTSSTPTTVTARADGAQAVLEVGIDLAMTMTVTPEAPRRGEQVIVAVTATSGGQPVSGTLVVEFGDGTVRDLGDVGGSTNVTHVYSSEGQFTVLAIFRKGSAEGRRTADIKVSGFAPGADQIDPALITWLSPATTNISHWPATSTINSVSVNGSVVCIDHTKAGSWPLVSIDDNPPNIEANILIVVKINGQWYGGGFDWLGEGRICKNLDPSEYGRDQIRVFPLDGSWPGPRSGDEVGLLISTPSSNRVPVRSVNERTNIVLVRWP